MDAYIREDAYSFDACLEHLLNKVGQTIEDTVEAGE